MKRIAVAVFAVLLLPVAGKAQTAEERPLRTISVAGTVEVQTAPDQIVWWVGLTHLDKDLFAAKRRNELRLKALLVVREKLGLEEGDIETGPLSIRREYQRDERGNRGDFKYFVVSRSVTIRQRDLKRFDEFLDAICGPGDAEVEFRFESSRIHQVRADTRLKALRAAKEKAAAMAAVVGAKLGKVVTVNEYLQGESSRAIFSNAAYFESRPPVDVATGTFVPGSIPVQVTVYATFELE